MTIRSLSLAAAAAVALAACSSGENNQSAADSAANAATSVAGAPTPAASGDTLAASTVAGGAVAGAAAGTTGALLDPNTASREQIAALPGMDAALADSLVARRPFQDMRAVDRVLAGRLSEQQRDTLYARMFKPLDLNKATKEEIELIPGVGPRMRHEFEEYRPYRNIEQFRREIGKYVKPDEVARLERYVTIRQ